MIVPGLVHTAAITIQLTLSGLAAWTVLATSARAQATTGSIEGRVETDAPAASNEAEIIVSSGRSSGLRVIRPTRNGAFLVTTLPVGTYSVNIRIIGYRPVQYDSVVVHLGETTTLPLTRLARGEVTLSPLVITSSRASVDMTSASSGATLGSTMLHGLPQERDVSSILGILPQFNASAYGDGMNVAGSTGYENAYFIDGSNVTDPHLGRGGSTLPYNFVREIQVLTGGYEAEFGRSTGGIVNVLTHSGSNEFRSEGFGYFTNNRFAGERRLGVLQRGSESYSLYDVGLSLGGPIARDHAWFFIAYNPTFARERVRIPSFAPQIDERRQQLFAGKLTWQPSEATTVLFTVHGDPSTHQRVGPATEINGVPDSLINVDPILGRLRQGGTTVALRATHSLTKSFLLEGSLHRSSFRNWNAARTESGRTEQLSVDQVTRTWSGGYGITIDEQIARTSGSLSGTLERAAHTVKGGFEIEENSLDEYFGYGYPSGSGGYRFGTGDPASYFLIEGGREGRVRARSLTAFLQDGWSLSPGLRVNFGMRWAGQSFVQPNGRTELRLNDGWQPRFGLIIDPGQTGKQKIYLSAGRFYEQLGTAFTSNMIAGQHNTWAVHDGALVDTVYLVSGKLIPTAPGIRGQYSDEIIAGYERVMTGGIKISARGVRREIRRAIEDVLVVAPDSILIGNPGKGLLDFLPDPRREYTALELGAQRAGASAVDYGVSYVLSETYGNYPGVFDSDDGTDLAANFTPQFEDTLSLRNGTGLLPNDRTHSLKAYAVWRARPDLSVGATGIWQSGTPLSEMATNPELGYGHVFLATRGTKGRTPSIVDVNLRVTYEPVIRSTYSPRIILDVFHVASRRRAVEIDQFRELGGAANPNYGKPLQYQSPMAIRLGVTLGN